MNRRTLPLCLAVALCCTSSSFESRRTRAQAQTPAAQTLAVKGLHKPVAVSRDERGIPHIVATNDADLYFAQGYVTAQDRLWQMDLLRRSMRGEMSEIFGQTTLEEDKRHRRYGFATLADELAAHLPPEQAALLDAYAAGVNAHLATLDAKTLPPEFQLLQYQPRPWRAADSIIIGKLFAEVLSTSWPTDLVRAALADLKPAQRELLLTEYTPLDVLVVGSDETKQPRATTRTQRSITPPDTKAAAALFSELARVSPTAYCLLPTAYCPLYPSVHAASNNWVVSGKHTASGKPLLCNDPHLPASAPSIWYMTHLSAPGLNVAGVTAPGAPGIIIGHNEHIAWGMTNLAPDVQDLYLEHFSADGKTYTTPQGPRPVVLRHEEIKVRKGFADATTETVMLDVPVTRHGPVILERGGARYSLRWTALEPTALEFRAFYKLNRARNWNEFSSALSDYRGPTQNFVYADDAGHIGYYGAGVIPTRKTGDGSLPYDGANDEGEWTGTIPFEQLPHVLDPPSGIIITANQRVVGRSYPHHLTHEWAAPYRARRIFELLQAKGNKLTADDMRAVQGDVHSIGGTTFAHEAAKLSLPLARTANDEKWLAVLTSLAGWDGQVQPDSRVAPWVAEMRQAFGRRVLTAILGAERGRQFQWDNEAWLERLLTERPADVLPQGSDYATLLRTAYEDARAALTKRLGADEAQWTWGRYAQARFPHPLASIPFIGQPFVIPPFPQQGSGFAAGSTVNVGASVSMRFIADPADWDRTQQGIALGVSGVPGTPHWTDQLADWRTVTPRAFPFTRQAVAAATKETLTLNPPN